MLSILLIFLLQLFLFFAFGSLICRLVLKRIPSFTLAAVLGFLAAFSFFEMFALPATLLKLSLSMLTFLWMVFLLLVVAASVIFCFRQWISLIGKLPSVLLEHSFPLLLLAGSLLLQMLLVYTHIDSSADASYYVGKVSTDLYTNSLGLYNPYTGNALGRFSARYLFSCYPDYNAVMCQFFKLHPLIQAKIIMPEIIILMVNMLYYNIGLKLFSGYRKKASLLVFFVFLFNVFSNTLYTSGAFLFTRTYEGKAILANVILTAILYGYVVLYQKPEALYPKLLLLGAAISSVTFSSSSMLMVPIAFAAGFFVLVLVKKQWRSTGWYFLYLLPNLATAVVYFLCQKGILSFVI